MFVSKFHREQNEIKQKERESSFGKQRIESVIERNRDSYEERDKHIAGEYIIVTIKICCLLIVRQQ